MAQEEMSEAQQKDFMLEKIKERPINKRRLFRRTVITAAMAVLFGLVACFTFLLLEPVMNSWLYPKETQVQVVFPEDPIELPPEDMLADSVQQQQHQEKELLNAELSDEEISDFLAENYYSVEGYRMFYQAISKYANGLKQCMVKVRGKFSGVDWLNNEDEFEVVSSGLVFYKNSTNIYILVNYKDLADASKLLVTFYNDFSVQATLNHVDSETGLAVLTVKTSFISKELLENENLVANLGSTSGHELEGIPVVALGNPMGVQDSIGYGIITAAMGESNRLDMNYRILQTNIYGNTRSTGFLFNMKGEVIGVLAEDKDVYEIDGLLSAYGISSLRRRVEKMSGKEKIPYIGVIGTTISENLNKEEGIPVGAYIEEVIMNSPGMRAGLKQGDIIIAFQGRAVRSFDEYATWLMDSKPGQVARITIARWSQNEYKEMTLDANIGELE